MTVQIGPVITQNLTIEHGCDLPAVPLVVLDTTTPTPLPFDLTGYTARMQLRLTPNHTGDPPLLALASGSGLTLGTTNGQVLPAITAAQSALFGWSVAYWDLEVISGGGVITKTHRGTITCDPSVSS